MTEDYLKPLVAQAMRNAKADGDLPLAIGVSSDTPWSGNDRIDFDGIRLRVYQCDSVLQTRQLMAEALQDPLVIVTRLGIKELGADVESRLLGCRLLQVDPWELLRARFGAKTTDASLNGSSALAQLAVEALGSMEPEAAPAGILTADHIWKVILDRKLGISDARPDVQSLVGWAGSTNGPDRWGAAPNDLKRQLESWLSSYLGDWAEPFLGCLEAGHGHDAAAIGLALAALRVERRTPEEKVLLAQALVRLERYTGGRALSARAQQAWSQASEQWVSASAAQGRFETVRPALASAEEILGSIGASGFVGTSLWLPRGFQAQFIDFGAAARAVADKKAQIGVVEDSLKRLEAHHLPRWSPAERSWLQQAQMAARLVRWLASTEDQRDRPEDLASVYQDESSWVDLARQELIRGDEPEAVLKSWTHVEEIVNGRRETENRAFALELARATARNSTLGPCIPVEEILERILAPWSRERVLLIVVDGMTFSVWRQLQPEVERLGFSTCSNSLGAALPPGLAVLPSVTTVSRCSLLSGELRSGGQDQEKRGFAEHTALVSVSRSGFPPVLFHKNEIGGGAARLSAAVRTEIRSTDRRVVGVVVNAIDDALDGADQRVFRWELDQIPVLRALLAEALESHRAVIITSDHGHVIDSSTSLRRHTGADRYRSASTHDVEEDEVLIQGHRVLQPEGSIVGLATERIRYSPTRKVGYHGGLTPQECLVPIVALTAREKMPDGWYVSPDPRPRWWNCSTEPVPPASERPRVKPPSKGSRSLFAELEAPETDWIGHLMASQTLMDQLVLVRSRLDVGQIETAARVLARRPSGMLKAQFSKEINVPAFRVDGFLANLQRILNLDGYPVLSVDASDTVRLDIELLKMQFGTSGGAE